MDHTRRRCLGLLGRGCLVLGAGWAVPGLTLLTSRARAMRPAPGEHLLTRTRFAMGTFVTITAVSPSADQSLEALEAAFAVIGELAGIYSRHDPHTPLSRLNREGRVLGADPRLADLVARARGFHRLTSGGFDPTVLPVVQTLESLKSRGLAPSEHQGDLERAAGLVGLDALVVDNGEIRLDRDGAGLTLDGIAKGRILDAASATLAARGAASHLINAGGDIRTRGAKPGQRPWTIAIQDPARAAGTPGPHAGVLKLKDGAVATSGNYEAHYDSQKLFHHLITPQTGAPAPNHSQVTVQAPTCMEADALATALFVLPPRQGLDSLRSVPGARARILDRQGRPAADWGRG
jgi:thiamine biosynthesis lipoprotein